MQNSVKYSLVELYKKPAVFGRKYLGGTILSSSKSAHAGNSKRCPLKLQRDKAKKGKNPKWAERSRHQTSKGPQDMRH